MLTRKQRWRRVRGGRSLDLTSPSESSPPVSAQQGSAFRRQPSPFFGTTPHVRPSPHNNNMHPLDSLAIGDSLLQLMGSSSQSKRDNEAAEHARQQAKEGTRKGSHGRVHFNHQVRVVLVPSRTELKTLKADIWWGDEDYFSFRREYIIATRANIEANKEMTALRLEAAAAAAATALKREERKIALANADSKHAAQAEQAAVSPNASPPVPHSFLTESLARHREHLQSEVANTTRQVSHPAEPKVAVEPTAGGTELGVVAGILVAAYSPTPTPVPAARRAASVGEAERPASSLVAGTAERDGELQVKAEVGIPVDEENEKGVTCDCTEKRETAEELNNSGAAMAVGFQQKKVELSVAQSLSLLPDVLPSLCKPSAAVTLAAACLDDEDEVRTEAMSSLSGHTDFDSDVDDDFGEDEKEVGGKHPSKVTIGSALMNSCARHERGWRRCDERTALRSSG